MEGSTEGSTEGSGEVSADMSADMSGDTSGDMDGDMGGDMGDHQPVSYAQRGLTLPHGTLRIDFAPADRAMLNRGVFSPGAAPVSIDVPDLGGLGGLGGLVGDLVDAANAAIAGASAPAGAGFTIGDGDIVALSLGAGFGVMDNLEVGAILIPLMLNPASDFGDISLYGRYRLSSGDTEVALQASIQIPTATDFGVGVGLPVRFHLGDNMMLNTGIQAGFIFADPDMVLGLNIPLEFAVNVMPAFFLGAFTGVSTALAPDALKLISLPLGVFGGYTVDLGNAMLLDITGQFAFPNFLQFGDAAGDAVVTDGWQITAGATFHYDLM